jgi:hypothetical protein
MEKNEKKIWFVNISEYHHRTMGLISYFTYYNSPLKEWRSSHTCCDYGDP